MSPRKGDAVACALPRRRVTRGSPARGRGVIVTADRRELRDLDLRK